MTCPNPADTPTRRHQKIASAKKGGWGFETKFRCQVSQCPRGLGWCPLQFGSPLKEFPYPLPLAGWQCTEGFPLPTLPAVWQ